MAESETSVPLKEHFERIMLERDKATLAHISGTQSALDKAETALNARLDGMNEFRDALRDQAATFVTGKVLDAKEDSIDARLKVLENKNANLDGRMWSIGAVIVIINVLIGFYLRSK